ncbi:MAG TPA: arsenate reductase (glutaredoxin) [Rhodanobacteraceae bacterium]|nr:arsenate reductase (glutaredoxin) [Rhodanobacteraceae bacterium]
MGDVVMLHNSRCSKSRETLALLKQHGVRPRIVDYLATPPDARELGRIADLLGGDVRALVRTGEPEYTTLGLADPGLSRKALLDALAAHPRLIQRPIVLANGKAAIGRPPTAVLAIL